MYCFEFLRLIPNLYICSVCISVGIIDIHTFTNCKAETTDIPCFNLSELVP